MAEQSDQQDEMTLSVQLANQFINIANSRLEEGMRDEVIAAAMRHAAANFSAFVHYRTSGQEENLTRIVEDFLGMFEYYLQRHNSAEQAGDPAAPAGGLSALIDQAKKEL